MVSKAFIITTSNTSIGVVWMIIYISYTATEEPRLSFSSVNTCARLEVIDCFWWRELLLVRFWLTAGVLVSVFLKCSSGDTDKCIDLPIPRSVSSGHVLSSSPFQEAKPSPMHIVRIGLIPVVTRKRPRHRSSTWSSLPQRMFLECKVIQNGACQRTFRERSFEIPSRNTPVH